MGFSLTRVIKNPSLLYVYASKYCDFKWINDETHLKLLYKGCFGRKLNLEDPQLFNEKLQWLKIHDRKPRYIQLVDKYEVKKYIAEKLGAEYVIPTLGVWENADDIDFDKLPERFVIKCTHDSHSIVICTDKNKLDIEKSKKSLNKALKRNYFYDGRQWPYKGVKPRIIAEAYMEDSFGELRDYKFTCFDGKVDNVMLCYDRASGDTKFYFFSPEWKLLRINKRGLAAPENFSVPKPENMDEMFRIAGLLSQGIPYARVDLYNINGKIYFGEITLYPQSGFDTNLLKETDEDFGRKIDLSKVKD